MSKYRVLSGAVCLLIIGSLGCRGPWDINRGNLNRLEIGMTKTEVIDVMGPPYKREVYDRTEWLSYHTEIHHFGANSENNYTPICIEDNKLIGWGRNYYQSKVHKFDVKLDTN